MNAAQWRMALIFNGSAKLQLFLNWLPRWANNKYLPAALRPLMEKQSSVARGQNSEVLSGSNEVIPAAGLFNVSLLGVGGGKNLHRISLVL